ncbi:cell envelope integrity TolA C-terminal domain-containing protein [Atlantibacter subterraneus]|uniref:cell envelope integrity TolA C-terminal domain-containing protein n=1 Tax=Atlantibacter subterraneus TaxID=255519 RepID=UPI0028AEDC40|nr:cell envelope integrity TolA C-terminal domain-containing protein [Atlantibacter subterranea]
MMKKIFAVSALALILNACSGTQLGVGAGTGFPGVGVGAGLSFPIGQKDVPNDEAYAQNIIKEIYDQIGDTRRYAGKLCTIRIATDAEGVVLDVTRLEGDESWCDQVMMAATQLHQVSAPPTAMVDRLQHGLTLDLIPK